jgi:hypothetical protein
MASESFDYGKSAWEMVSGQLNSGSRMFAKQKIHLNLGTESQRANAPFAKLTIP